MLNRCAFIGNLGRDAELKYTPAGAAVSTLSLGVTEKWTDKAGARQERTEWVRIVLWGKQAESLSEYLKKGKQIYVDGKMQTRQWEDKDGNKRFTTEIRGDRVVLLGGGSRSDAGPRHLRDEDVGNSEPVIGGTSSDPDDEFPF